LIKTAVAQLLKSDKKTEGAFKVAWQKNGKPVVVGKGVKDIGVSVSHDGPFLVVVAGNGEQGCDVETIVKRTDKEWLGLLGKKSTRY